MEEHHIIGRKNSDVRFYSCPNCHRKLSLDQYSWPNGSLTDHNSPEFKMALLIRSEQEIRKLIDQTMVSLLEQVMF